MAIPRPQSVAPGVSWFPARTPTLPPATHTNSYALGEREVLLVEPATPHEDERRAWLQWARALVSEGRNLVAIFLTHHHPDHIGGAAFFSEQLSLPLWAHEKTAALLPDLHIERHWQDGQRIQLGGPVDQAWTCLHTPGHAPGHLCLQHEEHGTLIVGDMVASEGTILIDPADGNLAEYLAQLERLATLRAAIALPAHGAPIDDPDAVFNRYLTHRLMRENKVVAALPSHDVAGLTIQALLAKVYDDTPQTLWPLAQRSLESHLIKLKHEGRARLNDANWNRTKD